MIQPTYSTLQGLFSDRVFRIPHYQRFYSWETRQRNDLFSDLRKLSSGDVDQHHFMATIVCHRTGEVRAVGAAQYRVHDVVDGQQRLTTLIILLKCIELAMDRDSEDRKDLAKILVKRDGIVILLQSNNANERIFNRFIREGIRPDKGDIETHSDSNLARAIDECARFVKEWDPTVLMRLILHNLGFIVYDTEDSRVVYTVFEVLNSRGMPVDWLDKTKSVLMGRAFELAASPEAADAEIQSLQGIWGHIYGQIAKESIKGDEILRITATLYFGPGSGKPRSADDALELLRNECNRFEKPRLVSERLLDVAKKLVALRENIYLGPVTDILHARVLAVSILSAPGINHQERRKLLEQWERVTFRIFGLSGKDSRTKVGDYVRMAAKIVGDDIEMRTYNQIMAALRHLGVDYPVERAVDEGLRETDFYERSPEICRYVLWLYEEQLCEKLGAGATVDEHDRKAIWKLRATDSIEHIFPQNPGNEPGWRGKMRNGTKSVRTVEAHVGRIGNLLLLPKSLNEQARNFAFSKKKEIYAKHNLRMVHEVCREDDWTLKQIEEREARIVTWAKTRWADL